MLEATRVYEAVGITSAASFQPPPSPPGAVKPLYELRQYQLHPGYGSVPKLLDAFSVG